MKEFAAIDFETANGKRTSICSVGIVIVRKGVIEERLYSLIKPYPNYYSPWTTRIHGLTQADTESAPEFPEVWEKIAPKIRNLPLIAHNSSFDEGCLKATLERYGIDYPGNIFYCTLRTARHALKGLPNYQLQTVSAYCGYPLEKHHHALADAEACAHIALRLF